MSRLVRLSSMVALVLVVVCLLAASVHGDKYELRYTRDLDSALVFGEPKFVRAIGMYADGDSAWGHAFNHRAAYIQLRLTATELSEQLRLVDPYEHSAGQFNDTNLMDPDAPKKLIDDVDFPTSDYTQPGFIQAIVLQAQDLDLLGLPDAESPLTAIETYCCTPFYVDQGLCAESDLGSLIIDRNVTQYDIWVYDLPLAPRVDPDTRYGPQGRFIERQSAAMRTAKEDKRGTYNVKHTGEHVLILSHCDPTLNTEVSVTGMTEWKNPFGFLPGRLFGFLNFHRYMLTFYVLFSLVWAGVNLRHWREFTALQFYTSIVLLLCVCEQLTWYTEYDHFNQVGTRHLAVITLGVVLSVLRQAVSRMLIVAVSLGYQIVKPSLGENKVRLVVLGGAYFLLECALELTVRYQQTHAMNDYYRLLLTLPVSLLNASFYWWSFVALYQLMQHLEERKQHLKFDLYRRFTNALMVAVVGALVFAVYQSYFMLTNQYAWHWSYLWLVDGGMSFLLYTLVLVAIAVLFRPANMASRFAYAPVGGLPTAEEEDETNHQPVELANARSNQQDTDDESTMRETTFKKALDD